MEREQITVAGTTYTIEYRQRGVIRTHDLVCEEGIALKKRAAAGDLDAIGLEDAIYERALERRYA